MKVRLGFAVAAQMEPDVLIIDEVLAVGDLGFVLKCFKTIDTILPNTAIVFVSHSMPMVSRICNQIMLMEHGKVEFQGKDIGKAIDLYYSRFASNESNIVFDDGSISLETASLFELRNDHNNLPQINWGDNLKLYFRFKFFKKIDPLFKIILYDKEQRPIALLLENDSNTNFIIKNNCIEFTVTHKNIQLSKGIYSVNVIVNNRTLNEVVLSHNDIIKFQVLHKNEIWPSFLLDVKYENAGINV
jgi:lipopolysaccharide transport system ATP-binding protein